MACNSVPRASLLLQLVMMAYHHAITMGVNFAHHQIQRGLLEDQREVLGEHLDDSLHGARCLGDRLHGECQGRDIRMRGRLHGGSSGGHRRADVVVPAPPSRHSVVSSMALRRANVIRTCISVAHRPSAQNRPNGHLPNGHGGGAGHLSSSEDEGCAPPA